jgi:exodeoxyribonuclease VII large subunit
MKSTLDSQQQLIAGVISRPVLASPYGVIDAQTELLASLKKRIGEIFLFRLERSAAEINQLHARAKSLSPKLTLERGYSVITDAKGKPLAKAKKGVELRIITSTQEILATTNSVKESND